MELYRIYSYTNEDGSVQLQTEKFYVLKETPCGYWVNSQFNPHWMSFQALKKRKFLKWVSKSGFKRLCYPTIKEAFESFKRRKIRQQSIVARQLDEVNKIVKSLDSIDVNKLSSGITICQCLNPQSNSVSF